jgi:hypothetical protein
MKTYFVITVSWSWLDTASLLRDSYRIRLVPSYRYDSLGFRLVKSDNEVPDSGEGEKPDTTCSNGEHP